MLPQLYELERSAKFHSAEVRNIAHKVSAKQHGAGYQSHCSCDMIIWLET